MQHLEVSGAVRYIHIYVIRRLKVKVLTAYELLILLGYNGIQDKSVGPSLVTNLREYHVDVY